MTPLSRFAILVAMVFLPLLARAEGKCGDDPWKLPSGELVVTWTLPVPAGADITTGVDDGFFTDLDRAIGDHVPPNLPQDLGSNIAAASHPMADAGAPVDPRASIKSSLGDLLKWEATYGIHLLPAVQAVFTEYFQDQQIFGKGMQVYASLVQHPTAPNDAVGYSFCTCSLQRGVAMWEGGKETLYVRSTFHSKKDATNYRNFRPKGVKIVFSSPNAIWFPNKLNRVLPDLTAPAFLVLDVLTPRTLVEIPDQAIPGDFTVIRRGSIAVAGKQWRYVRLRRTYRRGDDATLINDLALKPPAAH